MISIRYNVIGNKSAKDQESTYNKIANDIMRDEIGMDGIARSLANIYPKDDEFQHDFVAKTMPSRQSSRKLLFSLRRIDQHLSVSNAEPSVDLTLEHVLPYNPGDQWQEAFGRENYESAIDRLGNMALLPPNRNPGQEPFEQKRRILEESGYCINGHIAGYREWNIDSLQEHQQWLATQAKTLWRADSLEK